jgi:hypothetical protein
LSLISSNSAPFFVFCIVLCFCVREFCVIPREDHQFRVFTNWAIKRTVVLTRSSGKNDSLLSLIRHRPHRKRRAKRFFHCCVCIRCRGNVFADPFPSNEMVEDIYVVGRWDRLRFHYIPSSLNIDSPIRKLIGRGGGDTQTARWSHKRFFFLQNKESRLKTISNTEIEKLHEKGTHSLTLAFNIVTVIKWRTRWEVYFAGAENNECIDCNVKLIRHVLVEWYHRRNRYHTHHAAQDGNAALILLPPQFCAYARKEVSKPYFLENDSCQ